MNNLHPTELEHHSLVDWDMMHPTIHSLSGDYSISPPTSLKTFGYAPPTPMPSLLSRHPLAHNLSAGTISSYFRCKDFAKIHGFTFRDQSPLGQVSGDNRFLLFFTPTWWRAYWVLLGIGYILGTFHYTTLPDKWYHRAVKWRSFLLPDGTTQIRIEAYEITDTVWGRPKAIFFHPWDYWACSQINRCGLLFQPGTDKPQYADNTAIYTFKLTPEQMLEPARRL